MINRSTILTPILKSWMDANWFVRTLIIVILIVLFIFIPYILFDVSGSARLITRDFLIQISGIIAGLLAAIITVFNEYQNLINQKNLELKVEKVEAQIRENPEKPILAWDLARTKLENYLDRNLSQVGSIYRLTLIVMVCGFGFVLYGVFQASQNPEKLPMSIVASASGVLISFIGGSFLLIYKSILAQSRGYVAVLERINAVGMAVQVISSISESNPELMNHTKAELAKQLLGLYATSKSEN
jgi:hypothetical protein